MDRHENYWAGYLTTNDDRTRPLPLQKKNKALHAVVEKGVVLGLVTGSQGVGAGLADMVQVGGGCLVLHTYVIGNPSIDPCKKL